MVNPIGIVDRNLNFKGCFINGIRIRDLDFMEDLDREKTVVLITPTSFNKEILKLLKNKGFKYIYSYGYMELKKRKYALYKKCFMKKSYLKPI